MRRWIAPAALGALLVVGSAGALVLPRSEATGSGRADALARELRCPDCQGLSVADSPTQSAVEIRRQIDELLASGASADEVRAHFVQRYGDWILLAPSSPVAWAVPFLVLALGGLVLVVWLVRARRPVTASPPPDDAVRRRLHEEAEALDA